MKILITSDWYIPAINGVVTSIVNLRNGLQARGHEVRVLTLSPSRRSYARDGVTYIGSLPAGFVYPHARLRIVRGKALIQELIAWKPDIVHSNCEFSTFAIAKSIARAVDAPLVHTYHTVYEDYTNYFSPSKRLGKKIASGFSHHISEKTDCMVVPTGKVAGLLGRYRVTTPIRVVPTGISLTRFTTTPDFSPEEIRRQYAIPAHNTVLVYVGRLAKEKNCAELIRAAARLRGEPFTLKLVGDGPNRGELEEASRELGMEKQILFVGMVPPAEVWRYYRSGDLFASASTSETQGLTYLEALASGLPLLCRRDDCLLDVVEEGVNGWLYSTEDEFASCLRRFLADTERRGDYRENALASAQKFSIPVFAQKMEQLYLERLEAHAAAR